MTFWKAPVSAVVVFNEQYLVVVLVSLVDDDSRKILSEEMAKIIRGEI